MNRQPKHARQASKADMDRRLVMQGNAVLMSIVNHSPNCSPQWFLKVIVHARMCPLQ